MYGLPGTGKSTYALELCKVSIAEGYDAKIFNPGEERRNNPNFSWLNSADDFANNPHVLDQISEACLIKCLRYLAASQKDTVGIFDQTGTRKTSREITWEYLKSYVFTAVLVVDIYTTDEESLKKSFMSKINNSDYASVSPANAVNDFTMRYYAYKLNASHYSEDRFYMDHKLPAIRRNRYNSETTWENITECPDELLSLISTVNSNIQECFPAPEIGKE